MVNEQRFATHQVDHLDRVIDQSIEEMAELIKELLKLRRRTKHNLHTEAWDRGEMPGVHVPYDPSRERVLEELADVCINLEYIGEHFGIGFLSHPGERLALTLRGAIVG